MRILYIILGLFILPLLSAAQVTNVWAVMQYTDTAPLAPPATGSKIAYRMLDNTVYYWNGSAWVKIGTGYLQLSDTSAMLDPYISIAGWGLLKSAAHTLRADSTLLATRLFAKNLPTYITSGQVAYSNGSNLVGSPNFLFDGRVRAPYGYSSVSYGFVGQANKYIEGNPDGLRFNTDASGVFRFNSSGGSVIPGSTNMNLGFFNFWWNNVWVGRVFARAASGSSSNAHYSFQDGSGNTYGGGIYVTGTAANNNLGFSTKATAEASATAKLWINADGKLGIGTNFTTPSYILDINSTDALRLPRGTTAQRPTGASGILRVNTDNGNWPEFYSVSGWFSPARSATTGGAFTPTYIPFGGTGGLTESSNFLYISPSVFLNANNARLVFGGTLAQGGITSSSNNTLRISGAGSGSATNYTSVFIGNQGDISSGLITATSGTINILAVGSSSFGNRFDPSSGNAAYNAISVTSGYNTTGTYSGVARGFYYNPSVVSVIGLDERAFESTRGKVIFQNGTLSVNSTSSPRTLHVNGEARITDLITDTPTGIVGADGDGDLGRITISSDLKLASGTLGLKHKSLIDSLPIASVAIDGNDNPLAFNFLNSFTVDFDATAGSITSDGDITNIESDSEINLISGQDAVLNLTDMVNLHAPNADGVNAFRIQNEGFFYNFVNTSADPDSAFSIITDGDRGLIKMHKYGNGYVDATYTGEYPGKYILATTANHNVMDYRIDRDTLVVDANLSVGTLLYYTQNLHINLRMTALAATNSTVTFPDAAEVFRGKSIYVRVLEKDPGIYVPVINVAGGGSRLLYTSTTTTAPTDQSNLTMDNSTWPFFRTYKFTCLNTGTTPDYRWVLNQ